MLYKVGTVSHVVFLKDNCFYSW